VSATGAGVGFTVVDAGTVVATHLSTLINTRPARSSAAGSAEPADAGGKTAPKLVEDLTPKLLPLSTLQRVLQNLLDEGVHIRDLKSILETLADHAARTQDPGELTAAVRVSSPSHRAGLFGTAPEISVIALDATSSACCCR